MQRCPVVETGNSLASSLAYLSGNTPAWADYVAFGPFQWARNISHFPLLEHGDPVFSWHARMIKLFDHAVEREHVRDMIRAPLAKSVELILENEFSPWT
jgi:hypothetical protein